MPKIKTLKNYVFYNVRSLEGIYLRSNSIVNLLNTNPFSNINSDKFKIYVPADLVDSYKSATNWSTYADKIFAIPEEEET